MVTDNEEIRALRRSADDADARSAVKWAAASIAWAHDIKGLSDPAYIANIIEAELVRHEKDPNAPIVERPWKGFDVVTQRTMDELVEWAEDAEASDGARSAALRVLRSYGGSGPLGAASNRELRKNLIDVAERIQQYLNIPEQPPEITSALQVINAHRRALAMTPLDQEALQWTDEDVLLEAQRIKRLANLGRLMP